MDNSAKVEPCGLCWCFVASCIKISHSAGLCSQLLSDKGELLNLCAQDHRWYSELGARLSGWSSSLFWNCVACDPVVGVFL